MGDQGVRAGMGMDQESMPNQMSLDSHCMGDQGGKTWMDLNQQAVVKQMINGGPCMHSQGAQAGVDGQAGMCAQDVTSQPMPFMEQRGIMSGGGGTLPAVDMWQQMGNMADQNAAGPYGAVQACGQDTRTAP